MFFDFIISHMAIFWIVIAVVFATVEGITMGMVTIWFTIGAIPAIFVALFNGSITLQIIVFLVVSLISLILARPIFVKKLKVGREKNVVEIIEGKLALVTEEIAPFKSGLVKINGVIWTAVGFEGDFSAKVDEQVKIIRVEGVKLIVGPPKMENPSE